MDKAIKTNTRNSNVELLRIVGILLIMLNHTLQEDLLPPEAFPWSVLSSLLARLGGVGDVIFFGITAYYLCQSDKPRTVRSALKRIWILERQLLCYSIGLFLLTLLVWSQGLGFQTYNEVDILNLFSKSLFPLVRNLWWYPAAYAIFLLAQPFLDKLLFEVGGGRAQGPLAAFLFVVFSVPNPDGVSALNWTPSLFIYQYIVFSYVVRNVHVHRRVLKMLVAGSALFGLMGPIISGLTGVDLSGSYLNMPQALTPMVLGFSLVLLAANSNPTAIRQVNVLASCAFSAYLILCYPSITLLVSKAVRLIASMAGTDWLLRMGLEVIVAVSVFLIAVVVDLIRQVLFKVTFDKHRGAAFDRLFEFVAKRIAA